MGDVVSAVGSVLMLFSVYAVLMNIPIGVFGQTSPC